MIFRIDRYKSEIGTANIETHQGGKFVIKVKDKQGNIVAQETQPTITLAKMTVENYLGENYTRVKGNLIADELNK